MQQKGWPLPQPQENPLIPKLAVKCFNPFMYNVVKWPNILLKSCGVHIARFLKYAWLFYNIMHERVNHKKFSSYYALYKQFSNDLVTVSHEI